MQFQLGISYGSPASLFLLSDQRFFFVLFVSLW